MKKAFKIEGIDCPNCAAKLQDKLSKIEGVEKITLNFLTEKMTLQAADDVFDTVLGNVVAMQKELEPEWQIFLK